MSEKDIGLLNCLIERLLFTSKITRLDEHTCVSYIITRMELPTNYDEGGHLNVDVLFLKKIRLFVLSFMEDRCMYSPFWEAFPRTRKNGYVVIYVLIKSIILLDHKYIQLPMTE